ncbi:hypothetical protein DW893_10360, partial [Eubacterium ventriosum]
KTLTRCVIVLNRLKSILIKKRDDRSRLVKSLTFWGHLNIQIDLRLFYVHIISVFQDYYPTFIHAQMKQNLLTL